MKASKLISVYAPAAYCHIDVYVDVMLNLEEMRIASGSLMEKATHARFLSHPNMLLIRKKDGTCIFGDQTIHQIGIRNSEEFYLI